MHWKTLLFTLVFETNTSERAPEPQDTVLWGQNLKLQCCGVRQKLCIMPNFHLVYPCLSFEFLRLM